jgi:hypothetical protein
MQEFNTTSIPLDPFAVKTSFIKKNEENNSIFYWMNTTNVMLGFATSDPQILLNGGGGFTPYLDFTVTAIWCTVVRTQNSGAGPSNPVPCSLYIGFTLPPFGGYATNSLPVTPGDGIFSSPAVSTFDFDNSTGEKPCSLRYKKGHLVDFFSIIVNGSYGAFDVLRATTHFTFILN